MMYFQHSVLHHEFFSVNKTQKEESVFTDSFEKLDMAAKYKFNQIAKKSTCSTYDITSAGFSQTVRPNLYYTRICSQICSQ